MLLYALKIITIRMYIGINEYIYVQLYIIYNASAPKIFNFTIKQCYSHIKTTTKYYSNKHIT